MNSLIQYPQQQAIKTYALHSSINNTAKLIFAAFEYKITFFTYNYYADF